MPKLSCAVLGLSSRQMRRKNQVGKIEASPYDPCTPRFSSPRPLCARPIGLETSEGAFLRQASDELLGRPAARVAKEQSALTYYQDHLRRKIATFITSTTRHSHRASGSAHDVAACGLGWAKSTPTRSAWLPTWTA